MDFSGMGSGARRMLSAGTARFGRFRCRDRGSAPFPWPCWWVEQLQSSVGNGAGRWVLRQGVFNRLWSLLSVLGFQQPAVLGTAGLGCGDGSCVSRSCLHKQCPWGQTLSDGAMNRQSVVVNVKQHAGRAAPAPQAQRWA